MAQNLRTIRRRITSVKSTRKITRAMKLVASSKLRRAQDRQAAFEPYQVGLRRMLNVLSRNAESALPALCLPNDAKKEIWIVVAADRGLCGGFNSNVTKMVTAEHNLAGKPDVEWIGIGRKAVDYLNRTGRPILRQWTGLPDPPSDAAVADIAGFVRERFESGEIGRVRIVYNKFLNIITQKPTAEVLLPLAIEQAEEATGSQGSQFPPLAEPSREKLITSLIAALYSARLRGVLLNNLAGFYSAQMGAMDSATRNAGEMIDVLNIRLNRARQAAITGELLDIVNGKNAIEAS